MKTHRVTEYLPSFQPAYLSNGLIGLRIGKIPLPKGKALVNGFVGVSPENAGEEIAEAPYPVGGDVRVGAVCLSERPDLATFRWQEYDFSCGELRSAFDFKAGGVTVRLEVLTFCSRTQPTLVLQEVAAEVDGPCNLTLQGNVDPRGIMGSLDKNIRPGEGSRMGEAAKDGILGWRSLGGLGTVGVSYVTQFVGDGLKNRRRNDYGHEADMHLTEYIIDAKPGKRYVMRQYASMVPSLMHAEPHLQANRQVGAGVWLGFDQLRQQNREAWAEIWKGRPRIIGADALMQDTADSAFFYLHTTANQSMPCSMAPYGLSRRMEYAGHVFWDCETFMFPPVLLTAPEAARAILDYRSRLLPAARDNARLNGLRGVQYPWQSGNTGDEVSHFFSGAAGGITEQHINIDVAFAFSQYANATGDDMFIRQQAWPVLEGVAQWIVSRVTKTARGYEIRHITGPDEMLDDVHNNSYTNMGAIVVLREAQAMARRLGFTPPATWSAVEKGLFLPIDPATKVILKHDAFEYKGGVCIPETMGGFWPFGYSHSAEVDKATARFHIELAETYLGWPMFSSLFGVWAAREGERALARKFFDMGIVSHLVEPYMQFNEASQIAKLPSDWYLNKTVFLTNPAGFVMSLLYGLTGLQLTAGDPQEWCRHAIVMPEGWEGIEVERIFARNRPARLTARHGDKRAKMEFTD